MLRITFFHKVWNNALLELVDVYDVILTIRLHQYQWLEKPSHMLRTIIPCLIFGGWFLDMSKNINLLRACLFQTIAHWHNVTLRALVISKDNAKFIQSLTGIIKQ